jgi:titin
MTFLVGMWLKAMKGRAARGARNRRRTPRSRPTRFVPRLETLEDRRLLSVYAVINTNDSGVGSLRQAILDANAHTSEANTIIFDIRGQGAQFIEPRAALPAITNPVTIDATFQPGYAGSPLIVLNGEIASSNADGLTINADNSVVRGLDISFFQSAVGVKLQGHGDRLEGCYVGADPTGTLRWGNSVGVWISGSGDFIGGTAAGAGNLISGNMSIGIDVFGGNNNVVQGNTIGTDITGTQPLGNGQDHVGGIGVSIFNGSGNLIGGTGAGAGNLISGNTADGVSIGGSNNVVQGNLIGTDVTGTSAVANGTGISLGGSGNMVGGTAAGAGNLISGNGDGVDVSGSNNLVQGNRIGTDITGTQALGNVRIGVFVASGNTNTIGGTAAGAGNLISGNRDEGIRLDTSGNLVQGNLIGTDITGTQALGNGEGVFVFRGGSTIGGPVAGAGNLISGNTFHGIELFGSGNLVQGNLIGTDITGTQALGNAQDGVVVGASNNTIGGTMAGAGNVIAANGGSGVLISAIAGVTTTSNLIEGNFIGTDTSGSINLGNAADGVTIRGAGASNNTIGGTAAGAGNVIAFNGHDGVFVDTGAGNAILSDLIFANGNLGIELINTGNHNQAAPVLTGVFPDGPNTVIQGVLQSTPNTTFTVQFFADPFGSAEGQQLLGTVTVTTDAFGLAAFTVSIAEAMPAGQVITATATDAANDTSEFSAPATVTVA